MAHELHEKVIYAGADINKADWLTALAGVLGILGIGLTLQQKQASEEER